MVLLLFSPVKPSVRLSLTGRQACAAPRYRLAGSEPLVRLIVERGESLDPDADDVVCKRQWKLTERCLGDSVA